MRRKVLVSMKFPSKICWLVLGEKSLCGKPIQAIVMVFEAVKNFIRSAELSVLKSVKMEYKSERI